VPASDVVVEGYAAEEIAAVAEQRGVELIVMGTHGRTGMRKVLLGSVAERVIAIAPCPVLTVRAT
jgi:nucleotide-binding universal stress UspA family protein